MCLIFKLGTNAVTHFFIFTPKSSKTLISKDSELCRGVCSPKRSFQRRGSNERCTQIVISDSYMVSLEELPCTVQGRVVIAAQCPLGTSSTPARSPAWTLRLEPFLGHAHVLSFVFPKAPLVGPCIEPATRLAFPSLLESL